MNVPLLPSDALAFPSYPQMQQFSTVWCSSVQCSWTLSAHRWMWNIVLQLAFFFFHILEVWKNPEHHINRKVFLSLRKERVRKCNQMNPTFITENDSDRTTDNSTSLWNPSSGWTQWKACWLSKTQYFYLMTMQAKHLPSSYGNRRQ